MFCPGPGPANISVILKSICLLFILEFSISRVLALSHVHVKLAFKPIKLLHYRPFNRNYFRPVSFSVLKCRFSLIRRRRRAPYIVGVTCPTTLMRTTRKHVFKTNVSIFYAGVVTIFMALCLLVLNVLENIKRVTCTPADTTCARQCAKCVCSENRRIPFNVLARPSVGHVWCELIFAWCRQW